MADQLYDAKRKHVLNPARLFITESAHQAEKTDAKATAVIVHMLYERQSQLIFWPYKRVGRSERATHTAPVGAGEVAAPVMMTSFAFILGLLPLAIATGASQLARRDVGTPVFGGMILASCIGIFAIPPLYVFFQAIRERLRPAARPPERLPEVSVPAERTADQIPTQTAAE